jgi:hypothetical protein
MLAPYLSALRHPPAALFLDQFRHEIVIDIDSTLVRDCFAPRLAFRLNRPIEIRSCSVLSASLTNQVARAPLCQT